jgi:hypothetical protein
MSYSVAGCLVEVCCVCLFAFDPRRAAILLIGGNKRHRWTRFYEEMVPVADDLYDEHLAQLAEEGWTG